MWGGGGGGLGVDNSYPRLSPSKKTCSQKANISFLFFHILPFAKTASQLADIRFFGFKIWLNVITHNTYIHL